MKILYINPARIEAGLDAIAKTQPLSLITIAAMVPDHEAKLIDFKVDRYNDKRFRRELNRHDIVAITSLTPQINSAFEVAQMAKEQGCITLIGGYHPSLDPEFVAKQKAIDYAIRGEGENTFQELINYIDKNKKKVALKDIDGVSYKNLNGEIFHNKDRRLEYNLDNFPMPRRDLLRNKNYSTDLGKIDLVESSRGCPHSCKFCCIVKMWKDPIQKISYRTKSIKRIMQEIYAVNRRSKMILFTDDNFTINIKRTKKILDTIIRTGIPYKTKFWCQSRVDTLWRNQWLIKLLAKAGCYQVFLGIESVHQKSLDAMNKRNTTPDMVQKVVKMLHDEGITIMGGIIIGYPGETVEMVRQNILFAKSINLDVVQFTPITCFPGTSFYDEMKAKSMITSNNYKNYDLFHPMMRTEQLSSKDIFQLVKEAYAAYYLDSDYAKLVLKKFINPSSEYKLNILRIFRTLVKFMWNGKKMFSSCGITTASISDEFKNMKLNNFVSTQIPSLTTPKLEKKVIERAEA
ncbi:MAG: B12-binding domain-containing radical SAM protein [Promethearchaeota archaeon]